MTSRRLLIFSSNAVRSASDQIPQNSSNSPRRLPGCIGFTPSAASRMFFMIWLTLNLSDFALDLIDRRC
jgi:hypothetical protein